jgi:hypothetical protein
MIIAPHGTERLYPQGNRENRADAADDLLKDQTPGSPGRRVERVGGF